MKCPNCKNKGFVPSEDMKKPLKNLSGKESYGDHDTRRYVCLQCGYRFLTIEKHLRPMRVLTQGEMFDAG
jgi:DNA-directed RNA polymerase subunit RPC12/RpoP